MNIRNDVEECCVQLGSHKVTDRKKFADRLTNLLEKEEVITHLNRNNSVTWTQVISAVQECLRKDAEKCIEDAKKKGTLHTKNLNGELFLQVVKLAAKEASDLINVSKIVGYIIGCMKDSKMKTCYDKTFLLVLKECILLNSNCRGRLDSDDWLVLLRFLKNMCEGKEFDALALQCFMLLVKWGPTSGLLPSVLREEFEFITKLCQSVSQNSPTNQQEDVLDIALDFCQHTAKDNRVSCCKLGEDVFSNFIELYEFNGRAAKIKKQLVEFFLLQMSIHQPNGVNEGHPCAFACSWTSWKRCLKLMYSLLTKELSFYFKYHHKNSSFFITNGESTILLDTFSTLFVEVSHQLITCPDLDVTLSLVDCNVTSQAPPKRHKIEISLQNYIINIKENKSWLWIHIVCSVIKSYPTLLQSEDYLTLLQILSTIQIESNDHNVVNNIYTCLSVMLDIQNTVHADTQSEIDKLWKIISETTLKAFGLNQHKHATETLLQKLIPKQIIDLDTVLQTYTSGVINISIESIRTMNTTLQHLNYTKLENNKKEMLLKSILNTQNMKDYNYLLEPETATFLFNLTLRQWPMDNNRNEREVPQKSNKHLDVTDIYFKTVLEEIVLPQEIVMKRNISKTISTVEFVTVDILIHIIRNVLDTIDFQSVEQLLSMLVLLMNTLNCMVDYKILTEIDLNNAFIKNIDRILNNNVIKKLDFYKNKTDREAKKLVECVKILDRIFSFGHNNILTSPLKALIPLELLRSLMEILNELQEEEKISDIKFDLKKAIIKALSSFCCKSDMSLTQNQKHILEVIAAPHYDFNLDNDYILLLTFLNTLRYSKPGIIADSVLESILKSVKGICISRYHCSEHAVEILNILNDLYPHIAVANDNDIKTTSVALLKPFYENRYEYGPKVSISLLNCMGQICKVDPENNFSCWSDDDIMKFVPEFLCSDYQEIRFKAIETLITFFQVVSKSKQLQDFHRQEEIFAKMYHKSLEVFDVTGEITPERRKDEIMSRTASVLHTFTSIIFCCSTWTEECLFALVKLAYVKNLDLGSVNKVLEVVNQHFCGRSQTNCIEKYIELLLERWLNEHHEIDNFPFKLFQCQDKSEFYLKYFDNCVSLLISADRGPIIAIAQRLHLTEKDIVEKTCPKIFGRALCLNIENMADVLTKDKILSYYVSVVGIDGLKTCLTDNIDQLLLCILSFLTDDKYIYDSFEEAVIFSSKNLSVQQFNACLNFVESFLLDGTNIVTFLSESGLNKLEKVLLALKLNIYNMSTTDTKLKSFHRYIVWIHIILNNLRSSSNFHYFFIRDTIYTLINLMEIHKDNHKIVSGICKLLNLFLRKILPKYSEMFEKFLAFTVNSLKNYAVQIESVSDICIDILRFLIIENACHLMNAIEKLDNFPQIPKFESIHKVHHKIKYGNSAVSLEEEIRSFLQHEDFSTRQDSLVHLKNILSTQKVELKNLYDKLQVIRGFSEDCEESLLHRLICMLAKMSYSASENVKFEATKCLGELGPANLTTLVLEPEKGVSNIKCTAFELLSGHIISLLTEYIIDPDVALVQAASEVLYIVLGSKEGRKVGGSNINFGYGPIDKAYISPYFPINKSSPASNVTVLKEDFATQIDVCELWCPKNKICHKEWVVTLVTSLLGTFGDKSYLPRLVPICKVAPKFCEHLLPLIVNLLLSINDEAINDILSKHFRLFFTSHWNLTVPKYTAENFITVNKKSVKCMLNVVSFVRLQNSYVKTRPHGELNLNYLQTAKAAEFCAAHFTSLSYSELWCQARIEELRNLNQNCEYLIGSTMLDIIFENEQNEVGEALQNILRNAYKAIGDLDALPGCGISFLLESQFRVEHYKELGKWNQVTHLYEMQVSHGIAGAKKDLLESFKKCSLYQLPLLCTNQKDDSQYECLWRLGEWNLDEKQTITSDSLLNPGDYEKYRFYALKALHDKNEYDFANFKKVHRLCITEHLRDTSLESSQNIYPILSQLQALNEMEDFANATMSQNFTAILQKWKLQGDIIRRNNFDYVEPVIAQRIVMLSDYLKLHNNDSLKDYLVSMLLDFTELAKEEGHFQVASTSIVKLQFMSNLSNDVKTQIQLMDAQVSWSINNTLVAHHILNKLCKSEDINPKLRATALKLSGQYKSETFSENRKTIIKDYFLKSIAANVSDKKSEEYQNILDTYDKLAQFADKGYQQIMTYMKSDLFQRKIVNMAKSKQTASNIQKHGKRTRDECQAANIHNKQSDIDEIEIKTTEEERNHFLKLALKYYLLNLLHTDKNNIRVFRVMALFFESKNNSIIRDIIKDILPSYKYITMLPQLIPHITDNTADLYNQKVNEIVEKCAIEHPHHTLPLLLSLANSNKDREFSDPKTKTSSNDARVATANNLIRKLKRREELHGHITKLQQLSQALIELAYYKEVSDNSERKKSFDIPRSQKITKIQNFHDILLPTCNLPVSKSCNYPDIVGISSFGKVYHPVGGINMPKRITCIGTDGKKRSQLLKGHDDLRQDAVMQQVFTIMNNLLSTNKQTRNLLIRTYKIVPLSMRSGILEWVDNSMPIGDYLVGNREADIPGAHQVYRPNDKSPSASREMLKKSAGKSAEQKLATYKAICKDFKPVFHKFFESSFPHPTIWYERRRAYIHSVATTSMCGYILGIGDRHVSNILIDKTTAEVIHIDFGIAFEQGRVLPTPETVPFRLTRDVVDGMGVSGVEGIFRRSCEKTMEVLRQNSQTIITILEVLLYDPLYVWTVTSAEANKRQTDDVNALRDLAESEEENVTVNITAERALLRLREKLQGTELGNATSIEHQVGTLIQQAVDPANLCKLFCGWQAYL